MPTTYSRTSVPVLDYDHHHHSHEPIEVTLKTDHLDVLEVNDLKYTIKLQMYLGIRWRDPRIIKITNGTDKEDRTPLDLNQLQYLWVPDIDIYNLSKIESFRVIRDLQGTTSTFLRS